MTFEEAAEKILREEGAPLHYKEITKRAIDRKLIETQGKTPEETMRVRMIHHSDAFIKVGPSTYGLKEWASEVKATEKQEFEGQEITNTEKYHLKAAETILRAAEKGEFLYYKEIENRSMEMGLIEARLENFRRIIRHASQEDNSPFLKSNIRRATYGLREWGIEDEASEENVYEEQENTDTRATHWKILQTVLREAGEPLHCREIKDRALAQGYVTTHSSPTRSVIVTMVLNPEIFVRTERGIYGLREWKQGDGDTKIIQRDVALEILKKEEKPLHSSEIEARAMANPRYKGVFREDTGSPEKSLIGMMVRTPEIFVKMGKGYYGLKEWGTPEEGYGIDSIIDEGWFGKESILEKWLKDLQENKNLILQGPPGTGKSWIAKRLGWAFLGERNSKCLRSVQFHPSMSYEDFVRGIRPSADGKFIIQDGPLMEMAERAKADEDNDFVLVIEEINRGQPAQIFGEALTLLEASKRNPDEAIKLTYPKEGEEEGVYLPSNLYIIGTMNLADRSLAMVDFALRRRFAFADLEPNINEKWVKYMQARHNLSPAFARKIRAAMTDLNGEIRDDKETGPQYVIGHSYVTPDDEEFRFEGSGSERKWFADIVDSKIAPLLREYWYQDENRAEKKAAELKIGVASENQESQITPEALEEEHQILESEEAGENDGD